jgi:hypothetical protein
MMSGRPHDSRAAGLPAYLAFWCLALLVPTAAFRWITVFAVSDTTPESVTSLAAGGMVSTASLFAGHLLPADVLDVAVIVLLLAVPALALLRHRLPLAIGVSLGAAVVLGGANVISVRETGSPLTLESLRLGVRWLWSDPGVAWHFVTPYRLVLAAGGFCWAALSWLAARTIGRARLARRAVVGLLLILVASSALRRPDEVLPNPGSAPVTRGFWRQLGEGLARVDTDSPADLVVRSRAARLDAYRQLAYPDGRSPSRLPMAGVRRDRLVPRHIVIVKLETAPRQFYALAGNPDLPTFDAMSRHAIVSDHHYTPAPTTELAGYAMLSGTYPRPGLVLTHFGDFRNDSLPRMLAARGYESTYIESYSMRWNGPDESRMVEDLGFDEIHDSTTDRLPRQPDAYTTRVAREEHGFALALDRVIAAEARGHKALVSVMTQLGHYDWPVPPDADLTHPPAPLLDVARILDGLMGTFLDGLAAHGLADDVIVVVTGDHGLRFNVEFASLGLPPRYNDATFNVPFMLYAPALVPARIDLPWVTSHVDITPTLLDLTGTPRVDADYQGENMLDARLAGRATFFGSAEFPGLYPVSGFHYRDTFYQEYEAVGQITTRQDGTDVEARLGDESQGRFSRADVTRLIATSHALFNETAGAFLHRAATR